MKHYSESGYEEMKEKEQVKDYSPGQIFDKVVNGTPEEQKEIWDYQNRTKENI